MVSSRAAGRRACAIADANRRFGGCRCPPRELHPSARRWSRRAECRRRSHSGARYAACTCSHRVDARRLVDLRRPRRKRASVRGRGANPPFSLAQRSHACSLLRAARGRLAGIDFNAVGRLNAGVINELGVPHDADFYLCGPLAFMSNLIAGLERGGVAADRLHSETFGPAPPSRPASKVRPARAPHAPEGTDGDGPLVSFAGSNIAVRWRSTNTSLLELAERCDVPVRWSCRTGVCHTCVTG